MNYKVLYDNPNEELLTRLLKIRNITEDIDAFLEARLQDYWLDPFLLNDMEIAVERIIFAIKNKQKIMIFGDYDVD
jgi:single-stranded-DNA-specific exonuclease